MLRGEGWLQNGKQNGCHGYHHVTWHLDMDSHSSNQGQTVVNWRESLSLVITPCSITSRANWQYRRSVTSSRRLYLKRLNLSALYMILELQTQVSSEDRFLGAFIKNFGKATISFFMSACLAVCLGSQWMEFNNFYFSIFFKIRKGNSSLIKIWP